MSDINKYDKNQIREEMLHWRDTLDPALKRKWDTKICEQLISYVNTHDILVVHSYLPMRSEINIIPFIQYLLERDITVVCPKTLPKGALEHLVLESLAKLEKGIFKTYHPAGNQIFYGKPDLILVPGLAFDKYGYRIGYGGGYYDRFLKDQTTEKLGLFYSKMEIEEIPKEPYDVKLDKLLTEIDLHVY